MLLFLFFFGLALGAVSPSDVSALTLQRGNCPPFWYSFYGRCYKYVSTHMTWADAEIHCVSQRANLVSIHSVGEENFITHLIRNFDPHQGPTWIGLSDLYKQRTWMWSDGSQAKFFYWNAGEPNNSGRNENCVHTNQGAALKWNDKKCSNTFSFVCASRIFSPL